MRVQKFLDIVEKIPNLLPYFPDRRDWYMLPRNWIINVNSLFRFNIIYRLSAHSTKETSRHWSKSVSLQESKRLRPRETCSVSLEMMLSKPSNLVSFLEVRLSLIFIFLVKRGRGVDLLKTQSKRRFTKQERIEQRRMEERK